MPNENKPEWAKQSEFEKIQIIISGIRSNLGPSTQEQDKILREHRAEKVPWKDISIEMEKISGARRTTKALQARLESVVRRQHPEDKNLGSNDGRTEDQIDWLRDKANGKKKIDWNDLAVRFENRFDFRRTSILWDVNSRCYLLRTR
jgi:hypothetical protein